MIRVTIAKHYYGSTPNYPTLCCSHVDDEGRTDLTVEYPHVTFTEVNLDDCPHCKGRFFEMGPWDTDFEIEEDEICALVA